MRIALAPEVLKADWICPELAIPGVEVISTTRVGGVSRGNFDGFNVGGHVGDSPDAVDENRGKLHQYVGDSTTITWLRQVHGTEVIHAPTDYRRDIEADGVWSDEPGFACAVMTADCLPVVLADTEGRCVAAVHCGWRGLAGGILKRTVNALPVTSSCLVAWLGPAIGPSAFEVGSDVLAAFSLFEDDPAVQPIASVSDKYFLDLNVLARRQLLALGLNASHIKGGDVCTYSDPQRFYSFRRDGQTGRMVTLIIKT